MPLGPKPLGVGIDVLSWKRTQRFLASHSFPLIDRLLAPSEQALLKNAADPVSVFARLFTAKEAAMKAFGDSWVEEGRFRQIEILMGDQDQFRVSVRPKNKKGAVPKKGDRPLFSALFSEAEGSFFKTPNGIGARLVLWSKEGSSS